MIPITHPFRRVPHPCAAFCARVGFHGRRPSGIFLSKMTENRETSHLSPCPEVSPRLASAYQHRKCTASRLRASRTNRPILDDQPGDPPKLSRIVGNQRQAQTAGMSRDEQVVRSNHAT